MVWSDEFDQNQLDLDKWNYQIGTGSEYGLWGWGNGESQYYKPENIYIEDGILIIEARSENYMNSNYTSARINTKNKGDWLYGKFVARMRLPNAGGTWPAFWMLPSGGSWPCDGEIDIMEQWGNDGPTNQTTGAAHLGNGCQGSSTYQSWSSSISESYADDFHIYSIIWYENYIGWYVDGDLKYFITPESFSSEFEWPFNQDSWYLILNLAITNSGTNNNTIFRGSVNIKYGNQTIDSETLSFNFEDNLIEILDNVYYVNKNTKINADKVEIDLLNKKSKISMINKNNKVSVTSKY